VTAIPGLCRYSAIVKEEVGEEEDEG